MEMITIGCKLPQGLIIIHPSNPERKVRLNGLKDNKIIGNNFATTEVNAEFWATWKMSYGDYQPLKNGSIFEARNQPEAEIIGKELAAVKTGFEPLVPSSHGVKTATKD